MGRAPSSAPRGLRAGSRVAAALEALERARLRRTPQRLAIVRAFVDDPTHPTAQTIFDRLRRSMPTMSFATVYNTLAALENAGSCRVMHVRAGVGGEVSARFDPNVTPHDHCICDRCGAVRDVGAREASAAPGLSASGFRVRSVERVYRGTCEVCDAREGA